MRTTDREAERSRVQRARLVRGVAPIAVGACACLVLLGAWRRARDPEGPSSLALFDPQPQRFLDVPGATAPLYLRGRATAGAILFLGDSRLAAGLSLRILEGRTGERVAGLWNGFAQLDHLISGARLLAPRRVVLCLSPAAVHLPPLPRMAWLLAREREKTIRQRIDSRLDDELDTLRARWLRPVDMSTWTNWDPRSGVAPHRQDGLWAGLLGRESWAARDERFAALRERIAGLQRDGWSLACVRLPISASIEAIEDRNFDPERWHDLCRDLDLPYLDLFGTDAATSDGTHLLGPDADRTSERVAQWLNGLTWPRE